MRPILILYSSHEGQTRKVVAHVIEYLTVRTKEACIEDVESWTESISPADYRAVVLAASLHFGQHVSKTVTFVNEHREELGRLPTAFLPISLTSARAEAVGDQPSPHARDRAEIAKATRDFLEHTGLRPRRILPVAAALLYTSHGQFDRFALQHIADDTGLDPASEQALWTRLDSFIEAFLCLPPPIPARRVQIEAPASELARLRS